MPTVAKKYTKDLTKSADRKTFKVELVLRDQDGYSGSAKAVGETIENTYLWGDYGWNLHKINVEEIDPTK